MSELPEDAEELLATATYDELAVAMFTGKLHQLIEAGADFGVSVEQLQAVLVAINAGYQELTTPGVGVPN